MSEVFLSIGSNIKPYFYIPQAVYMLRGHLEIKAISTFYITEPVGFEDQPLFYNGVLKAECKITAEELVHSLIPLIEASLGRTRGENKYGPRTIDIDVLLYGTLIDENLKIPHPDIFNRDYVILCLHEIAPSLMIPGTEVTVSQLRKKINTSFTPLPELTAHLHLIAGLKYAREN